MPGGPVRQTQLRYRPARLGSIPGLLKRFTNTVSDHRVQTFPAICGHQSAVTFNEKVPFSGGVTTVCSQYNRVNRQHAGAVNHFVFLFSSMGGHKEMSSILADQ